MGCARIIAVSLFAGCSFSPPPAAGLVDAALIDAPDIDAIDGPDAAESTACPAATPETLALWALESTGPTIADERAMHDGTVVGAPLVATAGPPGCGQAVEFPAQLGTIRVADSPAWDLDTGSLELWVRPVASTVILGVAGRDASGVAQSGHIALVTHPDGFFVVRLQQQVAPVELYLCSNQAPVPGAWMHVAINFGAPAAELWVDGVKGEATPTFDFFGAPRSCSAADVRAIAGNSNTWVFGGLNAMATEGDATPVITNGFAGGAIDHVAIRSTRFVPP